MPFSRKAARIPGPIQDHLHVLAHGEAIVLTEPISKLVNTGVVLFDPAPFVGKLPVPSCACLSDLPQPGTFTSLLISLRLGELSFSFIVIILVTLSAAEQAFHASGLLRFVIRPLWSRDWSCEIAEA
jgi:hypothetical protein